MAEKVSKPAVKVPKAIGFCMLIGGIAGLLFNVPICASMSPLQDIFKAPSAQVLPYIFHTAVGSPGGGLGPTFLVLGTMLYCSMGITVAASRYTWAFARDDAIPNTKLFAIADSRLGVLAWTLVLVTVV